MDDRVVRAADLMAQALVLLDGAGEGHAAALLDHALALLTTGSGVRELRDPWPSDAGEPH